VLRALRAKITRNSRIEEQVRELAAEGTLIVETAGTAGQVNGLAVYDMGDYSFGSLPASPPLFTREKAGS